MAPKLHTLLLNWGAIHIWDPLPDSDTSERVSASRNDITLNVLCDESRGPVNIANRAYHHTSFVANAVCRVQRISRGCSYMPNMEVQLT